MSWSEGLRPRHTRVEGLFPLVPWPWQGEILGKTGKNMEKRSETMGELPSGKHTKNYGKSPFLMGKSTIDGHVQLLC